MHTVDWLKLNKIGFSLIETMMGLAVMAVAAVGLARFSQSLSKQQSQTNSTFQSSAIRQNILLQVNNDIAWQYTLSDSANTNLACLLNHTTCTGAGGAFRVRDRGNNIFYDPITSTTSGFTLSGTACSTFDAVNGDDTCPLRMTLDWQPICTGTCIDPQVRVIAKMEYKRKSPQRNIAFNQDTYGFNVVRGVASTSGILIPTVFDGAGTYSYTPPTGDTKVMVEVWGAGGAGGNGNHHGRGSGGGGGGYGKAVVTVVSGTAYQITVGAGGTGATAACVLGGSGGASSFGVGATLVSATGGAAGTVCPSAAGWAFGGNGGTSTATINIPGGIGFEGCSMAGYGGSSPNAGIGHIDGTADVAAGSGGGGAIAAGCRASFPGGAGRVIVWASQ